MTEHDQARARRWNRTVLRARIARYVTEAGLRKQHIDAITDVVLGWLDDVPTEGRPRTSIVLEVVNNFLRDTMTVDDLDARLRAIYGRDKPNHVEDEQVHPPTKAALDKAEELIDRYYFCRPERTTYEEEVRILLRQGGLKLAHTLSAETVAPLASVLHQFDLLKRKAQDLVNCRTIQGAARATIHLRAFLKSLG